MSATDSDFLQKVAAIVRNGWPTYFGLGGRHGSESLADMLRIMQKAIAIHPRSFRLGGYSTLREHMPPNHQFMEDINPDRLIEWAGSIGPQTTALVKATLQSRPFPQQAYRSCLGILSLAKKYSHPLMEQACKSVFEAKIFSSKVVQQELIHLQKLSMTPPIVETLPPHENIRGAEYYQERQLS